MTNFPARFQRLSRGCLQLLSIQSTGGKFPSIRVRFAGRRKNPRILFEDLRLQVEVLAEISLFGEFAREFAEVAYSARS